MNVPKRATFVDTSRLSGQESIPPDRGTSISVVMSTYNGEHLLEPQLSSIMQQRRPPDEVVIRDDGSSDRTREVLIRFRDAASFPVTLIFGENLGFADSFLQAALSANSQYIAFCDQDDVWQADKLLVCCSIIDRYQPTMIAHAHYLAGDVGASQKNRCSQNARKDGISVPGELSFFWYQLGCCTVAHRDLVLPIARMAYFSPQLALRPRQGHDMLVGRLANFAGSIYFEGRALVSWVRHSQAHSGLPVEDRSITKSLTRLVAHRPSIDSYTNLLHRYEQCPPKARTSVYEEALSRMKLSVEDLSKVFEVRELIYTGRTRMIRSSALLRLAAKGGYCSLSRGGLGIRSMLADSASLIRPNKGSLSNT